MPIPRYDEIQYPLLQHLADGAVIKKADLEQPMGDHFGLTDAERAEEYPSKNDFSSAWNQRMDALGAQRGTWAELEDLLPQPNDALTTDDGSMYVRWWWRIRA